MKNLSIILIFVFTAACRYGSYNQDNDLYIPVNFQEAYANKTRSMDGSPGEDYWQNRANYSINIDLEPESRLLKGSETITYFNNSPDTLYSIYFHLFPNYYKKGNPRDEAITPADASEGVQFNFMKILNPENENARLVVGDTYMKALLENGLNPGDTIQFYLGWEYTINENSHNRTGMVDETSCFVAYFFPRIAVYDDVDGWNEFNYTGLIEFYNDFGDFDVSISVPENYLVWATGLLQNPDEVLQKKYAKRYKEAFSKEEIFHIVDKAEYLENVTMSNETNTWKFKAENVSDFAFGTSNHYLWDATSLTVDTITGRKILIEAAYNPSSNDFYEVADIAKQSVEFMSYQIPGVPYPYPNITVFNGLSEMEYPMMVNDHSLTDRSETIKLTSHEIFHTYFPFYMGFNETRYAWMDEGWASYGDYLIAPVVDSSIVPHLFFTELYLEYAGTDLDVPMMTNSSILRAPTYWSNSYVKPATFLHILRDELGDVLFKKWIHEFMHRWNGKHPSPYDYFFTLNEVAGENMNWLIKPWFYEYGYVDLAVKNVEKGKILIENTGGYPVPVTLQITFDNSIRIMHKKASVWKNKNKTIEIKVDDDKKVQQVIIINVTIPDADLHNNIYPR